MEDENCVIWLHDIGKEDYGEIGEKARAIAELCAAGFPIPSGFVITYAAFKRFLEENGIKNIVRNMLKAVDNENLQDTAEKVQAMIMNSSMGSNLRREIIENYSNLNVNLDVFKMVNSSTLNMIKSGRELPYVAVRSSLVADEDYGERPITHLNVRGGSNIINAVRACWASLYSEKAMLARQEKNVAQLGVSIAVLVQKQVNAEKSGVIFTSHTDNNVDGVFIEAGFGYGEAVVLNHVDADKYFVDKTSLELLHAAIGDQEFMYIRDETMEKTKKMNLDESKRKQQVLNPGEIKVLARLGNEMEEFYHRPVDVEFGIENGKLYVLQTREYGELKTPAAIKKGGLKEEMAGKDVSGGVSLLENSESLFKMFDDAEIIHSPVNNLIKEGKKEQIYHTHENKERRGEKIIADIAGVKIELPKTKEGVRLMKQILELIEGQLE